METAERCGACGGKMVIVCFCPACRGRSRSEKKLAAGARNLKRAVMARQRKAKRPASERRQYGPPSTCPTHKHLVLRTVMIDGIARCQVSTCRYPEPQNGTSSSPSGPAGSGSALTNT